MNYSIQHPQQLGFVIGMVSDNGAVISGDGHIFILIDQITRGLATSTAKKLRCIPDLPKVKDKDVTTLGALLGASKKSRGCIDNLKTIQEADRFKGKINWQRQRKNISQWIASGLTLTAISKNLGVSRSALSKANKRFDLYPPKNGLEVIKNNTQIRRQKSTNQEGV